MGHHIERDLQGASKFTHKARGHVTEAREIQKRSHVLKVCILIALILLILVIVMIFLDSDACTSLSIC